MATQTRPFMMTGAVLATAASIVAASPAIAPSIASTTTKAVASANVQLATFSDIFTIPASQWSLAAFQGYGGLIGPVDGVPDPYAPGCYNNCYAYSLPALAYLAGDALINGNGHGWDTAGGVTQYPYDPNKPISNTPPYNLPYQPDPDLPNYNPYVIQPWGISAINYFYEGENGLYGISAGLHYLAQNTIGNSSPVLSTLLSFFFSGPSFATAAWNAAWNVTAGLVGKLPLVGTFASNSIYAMLGSLYNASTGTYYQTGPSGTLNYWIDVATGGYTPPTPSSGASVLASRAAAAASKAVTPALSVAAPVAGLTGARAATAVASTKAESTPASETTPADTTPADTTPADTKPADTTPADTTPADTKPADTASSVAQATVASTPAATKSADSPTKATRPHPVRDAAQKVGKQIANAFAGAKAAKADRAAN